MNPPKNNAMDLHARAAATLYGIINFDNFFRILEDYYPNDPINKEAVMHYFWTVGNNDPIYYIQDELIVHASILPDEIEATLANIRNTAKITRLIQYRILPQKKFLEYANPSFYEDGSGVKKMKDYLASNLKIRKDDVEEIMSEMAFVVRSDSFPTYILSALNRRELPFGRECELWLMTNACEMEPDIRKWDILGYSGHEVAQLL